MFYSTDINNKCIETIMFLAGVFVHEGQREFNKMGQTLLNLYIFAHRLIVSKIMKWDVHILS